MTDKLQRSVRAHMSRMLYASYCNVGDAAWHDAQYLGRTAVNAALIHRGGLTFSGEIPSGHAAIRWAIRNDVVESKIDDNGRVIVRVLADWPEAYEQDRAHMDAEYQARLEVAS